VARVEALSASHPMRQGVAEDLASADPAAAPCRLEADR